LKIISGAEIDRFPEHFDTLETAAPIFGALAVVMLAAKMGDGRWQTGDSRWEGRCEMGDGRAKRLFPSIFRLPSPSSIFHLPSSIFET